MTVKRYTALSAAAVILLLAACGKKEQPQPEDLACGDPAVIQNIQNSLQQAVKGQARTFAKNDTRGFVDADKVIAAASELTITLNDPQRHQALLPGRFVYHNLSGYFKNRPNQRPLALRR